MTQQQPDSKQILKELQRDLSNVETRDMQQANRLKAINDSIAQTIEHHDDDLGDKIQDIVEALEEGIAHFEADHPELSQRIRHVITTLTNAGL